jgi:hypothetical protein
MAEPNYSPEESVGLQDGRLILLDVMDKGIVFQQLRDENWKTDLTFLDDVLEDVNKVNAMFHGERPSYTRETYSGIGFQNKTGFLFKAIKEH